MKPPWSEWLSKRLTDVVIVNDLAHINGGAAKVALSSAIALAESGIRVTVVAAVGPAMPELSSTANLRLILTNQREIADDSSRLRAATQGIWNFSAGRALSQALSNLDPTSSIVHYHGWTKALSSSVFHVAAKQHFRSLITLHEYFTACPLGSFYNHKRAAICKLQPLSYRCIGEDCDPRSYRDKIWRVARQAVQRNIAMVPSSIRHYITLSDMSEQILKPNLPAYARIHRVKNPIDMPRRKKVDVAHNTEFTFVGRLSPEKGTLLFAIAAHEAGVRAVFVGDGECASSVRRANPNAEVTGWLSRADVTERLSRSRALVFPSLWYEISPLVIAEAAALGVPAIVPDSSVARDSVFNGITGRHFRGGDGPSLLGALLLLKDARLASLLGAQAYRTYWKAPQHMSVHLSDLTGAYEAVLNDAP